MKSVKCSHSQSCHYCTQAIYYNGCVYCSAFNHEFSERIGSAGCEEFELNEVYVFGPNKPYCPRSEKKKEPVHDTVTENQIEIEGMNKTERSWILHT